jgi:hypothetical protein
MFDDAAVPEEAATAAASAAAAAAAPAAAAAADGATLDGEGRSVYLQYTHDRPKLNTLYNTSRGTIHIIYLYIYIYIYIFT